jgi:hypothetical protein
MNYVERAREIKQRWTEEHGDKNISVTCAKSVKSAKSINKDTVFDTDEVGVAPIVAAESLPPSGPRTCQFVTDAKRRNEQYWFCTTHHTRVSDPLQPCFFSRYDGTPFQICTGWQYDGCPRTAHSHATFKQAQMRK